MCVFKFSCTVHNIMGVLGSLSEVEVFRAVKKEEISRY